MAGYLRFIDKLTKNDQIHCSTAAKGRSSATFLETVQAKIAVEKASLSEYSVQDRRALPLRFEPNSRDGRRAIQDRMNDDPWYEKLPEVFRVWRCATVPRDTRRNIDRFQFMPYTPENDEAGDDRTDVRKKDD